MSLSRMFKIVCATVFLAPVLSAGAGVWTNAAGNAIEADLSELRGNVAVFKLPDGSSMEMPLASLGESDRERARLAMRKPEIPKILRTEYDQCVRTLKRLSALRDAERVSADEYSLQRTIALNRFNTALEGLKLSAEERRLIAMAAAAN